MLDGRQVRRKLLHPLVQAPLRPDSQASLSTTPHTPHSHARLTKPRTRRTSQTMVRMTQMTELEQVEPSFSVVVVVTMLVRVEWLRMGCSLRSSTT